MKNKERFNEFIIDHQENARRLAEVYVKNPDDAEDVVAESIEKALRNLHMLKDTTQIKRWFDQIVIYTAVDHYRRQLKRNEISNSIQVHHFDDFSRLELDDLLDILPEGDRRIVSLRFVEKYELKEIADELGINLNTVKTRLYRALKKLKLELADEGYSVNVKKSRTPAKTFGVVVIAVLLSATLLFNLSPTLAAAAYDIPVLGDIIRVITFNRFEYTDKGYKAEIAVPEIQGLLDPELQDRLNAEFREYADDLILSFEASILELKELNLDELAVNDPDYEEPVIEPANMSVKADYEIKTDNDNILSLATYLYSDVGGYSIYKFYNIDKRTGKLIALSDLFKPDADYITPISAYVISEMERLNDEEEDPIYYVGDYDMFVPFTAIRPDHNFYINNDGKLVICFDRHEVAAGYIGSPEFVVPSEVINDIVSSDLIG